MTGRRTCPPSGQALTARRLGARTAAAITAVTALSALLFPLLAAPADAYVYWVNNDTGTIGRAKLDGTGVDQAFITVPGTPQPGYGVAVSDKHIYWSGGGWVGRANLDGTGVDPKFIPTVPGGGDAEVAVGGGRVIWANTTSSPWIGSAKLDGTAVNQQALAPQSDSVRGLALQDGAIYWSDYQNSRIGNGTLSPPAVNPLFISPTADRPEGLAVDEAHVYWSNGSGSTIGRAKIDGSGVDQSFIPTAYAYGVEVNERHIYWANYDTNSIGRARLSGAKASPTFITGATGPEGIALDAGPDTAVEGSATARSTQRQKGKRIVVKVKVKAEEDLDARAAGKVKLNPAYKLKPRTRSVEGGKSRSLKLRPRRDKDARRIAAALSKGAKASAKLRVKLSDRAGNEKTAKLKVKLKR